MNVKFCSAFVLQQNAKKRKLEDGGEEDMGECQNSHLSCIASLELMRNHCYYSTVSGTKVFVMPGGMMKSNGNLVELIEKVKPEIRTLIEKCNTVSSRVMVAAETS